MLLLAMFSASAVAAGESLEGDDEAGAWLEKMGIALR